MTFLLDTNVYIDAFNDPDLGAGLQRFHRDRLGRILLSQVVAFELLVGARGAKEVAGVRKALVEPFTRRRRLHVPAASTWELAAEIERRLRREGGLRGQPRPPEFRPRSAARRLGTRARSHADHLESAGLRGPRPGDRPQACGSLAQIAFQTPLADLASLEEVSFVMKGGQVVKGP